MLRCRRDQCERSDEPYAFGGRKRIKKTALGPFRRQPGAAQYPASCMADENFVGPSIALRTAARQEASRKHAPNHFRERRAIDARGFDERRLARAVVLIERGQHQILLFRQIFVAGFLGKQISEILIAPAKEMRRCASELKAAVRLALCCCVHADPKPSRDFSLLTRSTPGNRLVHRCG